MRQRLQWRLGGGGWTYKRSPGNLVANESELKERPLTADHRPGTEVCSMLRSVRSAVAVLEPINGSSGRLYAFSGRPLSAHRKRSMGKSGNSGDSAAGRLEFLCAERAWLPLSPEKRRHTLDRNCDPNSSEEYNTHARHAVRYCFLDFPSAYCEKPM